MTGAAGLLVLVQAVMGQSLTVTVDRPRVVVGEEVTYSLRALGPRGSRIRVELPTINGLEAGNRTEQIEDVAGSAAGGQVYQLDVVFRAAEPGLWRIGPVLVFRGDAVEAAPDVVVTVAAAGGGEAARNPRLMALIRGVAPPADGAPASVAAVVSSATVFQGEQLDIVTAAWFSRSLRARLRRPPTLKPPVLSGVWSVPQPAVPGIVTSRSVGDDVYDLFVSHQVAFPLTAGRLVVPPARLEYAVPLTRRASGDERPMETASDSVTVVVTTQPLENRPAGFQGPTGHDLRLSYRVRNLPAHTGEPVPVDLIMSGGGNLAFWGPPNVAWPAGTRAYLDRTREFSRPADGFLGGSKTFQFLLVPDSVGSIALPDLVYSYFDPVTAQYREAATLGLVVPVLEGRGRLAQRTRPPLIGPPRSPGFIDWVRPGAVGWWGVLGLGLLVIGIRTAVDLIRRRPAAAARPPSTDPTAAIERVISALVPERDRGRPEVIEQRLRQAGLERDSAAAIAVVKSELDRLRFNPGDATGVASLGQRAGALVSRLPKRFRRHAGLVVCLMTVPALGSTQTAEAPETLYHEGAFGPAAARFDARARTEPSAWTHWYHAGAAYYLAGADAAAAARLVRALALAPRAAEPRAVWNTLERQYEPLREARPREGLSRPEIGVVALGGWLLVVLWFGVSRRSASLRAAVLVVGTVGAGGAQRAPESPRPLAFAASAVRLKRSPHGLAPDQGGLPALARLAIESDRGPWVLVSDRSGNRGWVPSASVARIDRVD